MRHGDAGPRNKDQAKDDARELTPDAVKAADAVAQDLKDTNPAPHAIYASPIKRAQQTAAALGKAFGLEVQSADELHPHKDAKGFIEKLAANEKNTRVAVVGHHDNLGPALAELGDIEQMAKGEVRRYRIKRDGSGLKERDRICPSDVGDFDDEY